MLTQMSRSTRFSERGSNDGTTVDPKRPLSPLLDVFTLGGAGVVAGGISAMTAMVAARLLGPAAFGLWQTARVILQYTSYSTLGVEWGMHRELPYIKTRDGDDTSRQREIVQVTLGFTMLSAGIVGLATGILGPIVFGVVPSGVYYILGIVVVSHQLYVLADKLATASGRYGLAGAVNIATSCASLVLGVIGILTLGVRGLLLSQICWGLLGLILITRSLGMTLRPELTADVLRKLVSTGLPVVGNGLLHLAAKSVDRLTILAFLGTTYLGYYGLALAVASYLEMTFQAIGRVVLPRFSARYAENHDLSAMRRPITRVLLVQTFAFSALGGVIVFWLPVAVHIVLPAYQPGIAAASVLMFGMVLLSVRSTLVYFFLASDRLLRFSSLQIPLVAIGVAFVWLAMRARPSILMAATASSILYGTISLIVFAYALRLTGAGPPEIARTAAVLVMPVVYAAVITWLLHEQVFHLDARQDAASLVLRTTAASALFVVAQAPMVVLLEHITGAVREALQVATTPVARRRRAARPAVEGE